MATKKAKVAKPVRAWALTHGMITRGRWDKGVDDMLLSLCRDVAEDITVPVIIADARYYRVVRKPAPRRVVKNAKQGKRNDG